MTGVPLFARGLSVGHGGASLFPSFDLAFHSGELVCLLGRNGAGKTTLLKTLAGLMPPLRGSVFFGENPISDLSGRERAQRAALSLADPGLPPYLLGRELVGLGRTPHAPWFASARETDDAVASRILKELECEHLADRPLGRMSDGERQRLGLARALAQDAPILLLDEPLSHLDPPAKAKMLGFLRDWARSVSGRVVVAAVHEVDLALCFADRCLLLSSGASPFFGTPEEAALGPLRTAFPGWPEYWDALGVRKGRIRVEGSGTVDAAGG
ncbi:MAG TPA: ABC transporter ATP-binding protein [Fibrobacteria bacterium]|nr:ABC transporter ATP-binding protein [Fibrobacteria bacterium]